MPSVTLFQAKSKLSRLVRALESGREHEIIITRGGCPVARLIPVEMPAAGPRLGIAKGLFTIPEDTDSLNEEVGVLFNDDSSR